MSARDIMIDIPQLNRATTKGEECEEMIRYLSAELEALKIFSHSAIINYGKVIGEKNKFEREVNELKNEHK